MKTAALLAAAGLCLFATDALAQSDDPDSIVSFSPPAGERTAEHWTPPAIDAAAPAEMPSADPAEVRSALARQRAGRAPGASAEVPSEDLVTTGAAERSSGAIGTRPLYWAGKILYTMPDGRDSWCSAQFIARNLVLTAAHCVTRDKDWVKNLTFALEFENERYVHLYRTRCFAVLNGWFTEDESKWGYDFAVALTTEESQTGSFGQHTNWGGTYTTATTIGYPQTMQDGEVIQVDSGPVTLLGDIAQLHHGVTLSQKGRSGGAWVGKFSGSKGDNKNNYAISVNSFQRGEGSDGNMYGPILGDSFVKLRNYVAAGCKK
jgi:hypothetical protein